MPNREELKKIFCQEIDRRKDEIIGTAIKVLENPESGFREVKTSRTVSEIFSALAAWAARCTPIREPALYGWIGAGLFVALNGIVLRTAHHWADIPWRLGSMLTSKPLQAALTVTWSATALSLMVAAARRRLRPLWMLGAALLAVAVGKLFLVDLGALSGLPRVAAFLGAGVLPLVMGNLSPLPPAASEAEPRGDRSPNT